MMQTCQRTGRNFTVYPDEEAFLQKISFTFGQETIHPPLPVYEPEVRLQLRAAHRNEQHMYKTKSALSGKDIVSLYHPDGPYKVYSEEEWKSDRWDPMEYGREFDFSRPFFDQFYELQKDMPRIALISVNNENSDFTTGTGYCKNCYLINSSENCEDCYYGKLLQQCTSAVDCSYLYNSELCYECFSVYGSYKCQHVSFSQNCNDCFFSSNLKSCSNCCLCTNLSHKEYHFMNEPLSREEYEERLREFRGSPELTDQMKEKYVDNMRRMVWKYANISNCENCTGDYLENSRNCLDCYDVNDSEDCRYIQVGVQIKDCYDCCNMYLKPELCYDTMGTIEAYNCAYCLFIFYSRNLLYSEFCFNCSDCFGCSGLTRRQYCVFNKQYTKEEYERLVPKIIEHMKGTPLRSPDGSFAGYEWGLFFPPKLAPFGYNESLAGEYMPLAQAEAEELGFSWREAAAGDYKALPDAISCEITGKNFRLTPQELKFYKNNQIPLPRRHPDQRHKDRMALRNPRQLWQRQCDKCSLEIKSTFAPERPVVVYCEDCYLATVF